MFLGGAGKNQQPVDFQRCWGVPNQCWMAPNAVIALVDQQIGAHPLAAFVDLHSPGLGQETMTVAIDYSVSSNTDDCPPPGEDCHTAADIAYLGSFLDQLVSAVAAIKGPNTFNRRIQNISVWKSDVPNPGPGLMANRYALKYWMRSTPRGLSVPMEISHYKDGAADGAGYATGAHVTKQGLLDYGRGLGEALLWHLSAQ